MKKFLMFTPIGKTDVYTVNGSKRYLSSEIKAMGYIVGAPRRVSVAHANEPEVAMELLELVPGDGASKTRALLLEVK